MKRWLMVLLWVPMVAAAEIYRWTDDQGRVHFSDAPVASDAERVEVKVQTIETVRVAPLPSTGRALAPASASVVMYSTPWCGVCKRTKRYFNEQGIRFTEKDIEANEAWRKEFDQLGGRGVPLILVGKRSMSGFSASSFQALYDQAQR